MHTLNKNFGYVLIITIFLGFVPVLACLTPPPPPPGDDSDKRGKQQVGGGGKEECVGAEPIDLTNGAYYGSFTDLKVKGKTRNIAMTRSYTGVDTSKVRMDASDVFSYSYGTVESVYWNPPAQAQNVYRSSDGKVLECTFPYSGSYVFSLTIYYSYLCGGYCPPEESCALSTCYGSVTYDYTVDYSVKAKATAFGNNWDLNYNIRLDEINSGKILLCKGNNRSELYTVNPNNSSEFFPPGNVLDSIKIVKNQNNNTYTLQKKQNEIWEFNNSGQITQIRDLNNNCINFGYTNNKLASIVDDLGNTITLNYNSTTGLLETITDASGRQVDYTYEADNDLSTVTCPATDDYQNGLTTVYTYDSEHRLLTIEDPANNVWLSNTYTNGRVATQRYGGSSQEYSISYYIATDKATVTDRRGNLTIFTYSDDNLTLSKKVHGGIITYFTTTYTYTNDKNIDEITLPKGNKINYDYDSYGNVSSIQKYQDSDSLTYSVSYDDNGFIQTYTDPENHQYLFTYDYEDQNYGTTLGRLMKVALPTVKNENDSDVTPDYDFTYNNYGQVETVELPDGKIVKYDYGTSGNNNGRITKFTYDYGTGDALNIEYQFTYDSYGKIDTITKPDDTSLNLNYNALLQLTQVQNELGFIKKYHYNENGKIDKTQEQIGTTFDTTTAQTWEYDYDILDNLTQITNPLGYVTEIDRDDNDNITSVMDPEGRDASPQYSTGYTYNTRNLVTQVTDAEGADTTYNYDGNGNLTTATDDNGKTTTYHYDFADRCWKIVYPDSTYEQFTYDDNSNITQDRKRDGTIIYYTYDALNRKTSKQIGSGTITHFKYDIMGRLRYVIDGTTTVASYSYDRIGRLTSTVDSYNRTVGSQYNDNSQRTRLTYPDGHYISYEYYDNGMLRYIKDDSSTPVTLATFEWDTLSRLTRVTYANGQYEEYDYEDAGTGDDDRGNNVKQVSYSPSAMYSYDYIYDKVSNATNKTYGSMNYDFTYDNKYQLTATDYYGTGNDYAFSYDGVYNRTSVIGRSTTNYSLNTSGLNQYATVGTSNLTYDDNGNLTSYVGLIYQYDHENKLTAVLAADIYTTIRSYAYNWDNSLASMCRAYPYPQSVTTTYVHDGPHIIAEYEDGTLKRKFIYGPGIDFPVLMISVASTSETKYYYFHDALGSVVALLNNSGSVVESYHYTPFGFPTVCEAAGTDGKWLTNDDIQRQIPIESGYGNPYMFTARRWEHYTGLYYYRARFYSPNLGRFLQPDPIGYYDSMNLYQYCLNNSVNFVDPLGLAITSLEDPRTPALIEDLGGFRPVPVPVPTPGIWDKIWDKIKNFFNPTASDSDKNCSNDNDGHRKNQRESNRGKHEKGDRRRGMDRGGEKGDQRRPYQR